MKWKMIPTGQTNGAFQRFMVALSEEADLVVTRINNEPAFVERLASFAKNGTVESPSQELAHIIMGQNFFGIEEAVKHFGINPSRRQLATLSEVPFSEETLMICKNTHILVAVFPLSIVEIRSYVNKLTNKFLFCNQNWYNNEEFANQKGETGWQLFRKIPFVSSTSKSWEEQEKLLFLEEEETTKAQIVVYTIVGHFLNTRECLLKEFFVRCDDVDSLGYHVNIGNFVTEGIEIYYWSCNSRIESVGVASTKK